MNKITTLPGRRVKFEVRKDLKRQKNQSHTSSTAKLDPYNVSQISRQKIKKFIQNKASPLPKSVETFERHRVPVKGNIGLVNKLVKDCNTELKRSDEKIKLQDIERKSHLVRMGDQIEALDYILENMSYKFSESLGDIKLT
jgi:hypothetical protein